MINLRTLNLIKTMFDIFMHDIGPDVWIVQAVGNGL